MKERHLDDGEIVALRDGALEDAFLAWHAGKCPLCRTRLGEARLRDVNLRNPKSTALTHPDPLELAAYAEEFAGDKPKFPPKRSSSIRRHLEDCFDCRTIVETSPGVGAADVDVTIVAGDALRRETERSLINFLVQPSQGGDEEMTEPWWERGVAPSRRTSLVLSAPASDFGPRARPREEALDLGTLEIWVGKDDEACTFAYLPSAELGRRRPDRRGSQPTRSRRMPRWWEDDGALREKLEEIRMTEPLFEKFAGRRAAMMSTLSVQPAPLGAMRLPRENRVELGLGTAGWLTMQARRRGAGVWLAFERPPLLAACPLTIANGRSDRFDPDRAKPALDLALGRHTLRSLDPSRDEDVLLQLRLDIRAPTES